MILVMGVCSGCGRSLTEGVFSCPHCGGTAVPPGRERDLQPLFRPGDLLEGRFQVEKVLGTGATGVVYGVLDTLRQHRVALKVLWEAAEAESPTFQRLRREIGASQRAPNEHLVAIHDLILVGNRPALVMEWVEGESLREKVKRDGALPWREAVDLVRQVLLGLAHLHRLGIVHRDVKGGNVLLGADGTAKLGDFGLAKGEELGASLTATGASLGTPGYMAPEVIRGGEATGVSDLYSTGVLLFELLSGRLPHQGLSALEVASRQLSEGPPLHLLKEKKVPRWLARIAARLLEREPGDRFPSAGAVLEALESHSPGFAVARRWRWRAALLLLAALAAGGLYGLRRWMAYQAPLTMTFHDKTLEAHDPSGGVVWTREMPRTIQSAIYGRFGPGGKPAVACAITWAAGLNTVFSTEEQANQLYLLDRRGSILNKQALYMGENPFDAHYGVRLSTHQFSRRGHDLLVLMMRQELWYPCCLSVLDFDGARQGVGQAGEHWDCSIYNSGYLDSWAYRDLDGDGVDEIVYAGVNNRLYWSDVVGAAKLHMKGPWTQGRVESPDFQAGHLPLYYRCFSFRFFSGLSLKDPGPTQPLRLAFSGGPSYGLDGAGGLWGPTGPVPPPEVSLGPLNGGLANLCALRDSEQWEELLGDARAWSRGAEGAYVWLGRLFQAQALMGLGRYNDAIRLLDAGMAAGGGGVIPAYAYQFQLDSLFLGGRYKECLAMANDLPAEVRSDRPELAVTAAWDALYSGAPSVVSHWLAPGSFSRYSWEPDLFEGIASFLKGDFAAAETQFRDTLASSGQHISDPGRWLVQVLTSEGKVGEARKLLDEEVAAFPADHLDDGETALWLRWNEGSRSTLVVSRFDALVAKKHVEAKTTVETRALLPITLARAAAVHRAAGQSAEAARLKAEALRLAPAGWAPLLDEIAGSR